MPNPATITEEDRARLVALAKLLLEKKGVRAHDDKDQLVIADRYFICCDYETPGTFIFLDYETNKMPTRGVSKDGVIGFFTNRGAITRM